MIVKTNESKSTVKEVKPSEFMKFMTFKTLWTLPALQIIYLLGTIGITLSGLGFLGMSGKETIGIALLIVGNLAWRLICETWTVLFSMHEALHIIADKVDKGANK